jgi:hypothetical protein
MLLPEKTAAPPTEPPPERADGAFYNYILRILPAV